MSSPISVPDLMVPSPSRPRFSQEDLDSVSVHDLGACSSPTSATGKCWEEYGDLQLLTIKRVKEFPDVEAISRVMKKRQLDPKPQLGLTQEELDALCQANDSQTLDEDQEEDDAKYVKLKKEKANSERSLEAPSEKRNVELRPGLCLGFSQSELDAISGFNEAEQPNVPVDVSSPHGSALTAVKRANFFQRKAIMPTGMEQAELDAFIVEAASSGEPLSPSSPHGRALNAVKRGKMYKRSQAKWDEEKVEADPGDTQTAVTQDETFFAGCLHPPTSQGQTDEKFYDDLDAGCAKKSFDFEVRQVEARKNTQADLDALCVDAPDEEEDEDEGPSLQFGKKVELQELELQDAEENEQTWSPWNSPRRSPSPVANGRRSPSPVRGGA